MWIKLSQLDENMHTGCLLYFQYTAAITIRTASSSAYHWKLKHSAQVSWGDKLIEFGVQTSQDRKAFADIFIHFSNMEQSTKA